VKSWLHPLLVLAALSIFLCGCGRDSDQVAPGDMAKDFRLDTLSHKRFYLNQHKDKVVVLVFWTTWCSICKAELVDLKSLVDMSDRDDLIVAGVCSDPENADELKQIADNLNLGYPLLLDEGHGVTDRYNITAFPTTLIIDQKGVVSFFREGYSPVIADQIKTKVDHLLITDEGLE